MSKVIYIIALVLFVPGLVLFIADSGTIVLPLSALLGLTGAVISLFEHDTDTLRAKAVIVVLCGVTLAGVFFFLEYPKIAFALALLSTIGIELVMIVSLMRRSQSKLLDRIASEVRDHLAPDAMESPEGRVLKTPEPRTAGTLTEDAIEMPAKPGIDADHQEVIQGSPIDHSSDHDAVKLVTRLYSVAPRQQKQISLHVWKALNRERDRVFHGSEPGQLVIHGSTESHRRAAILLKLLAAGESPENIPWPTGPFTEPDRTAGESPENIPWPTGPFTEPDRTARSPFETSIGHLLKSSVLTLTMTLLGAIIGIAIGRNHDVDISSIDGDPLTMLILGPFIAVAFALAKIALMAVYATVGGGVGMCFGLAISTADRTRPKLTHVSPPHASDSAETSRLFPTSSKAVDRSG